MNLKWSVLIYLDNAHVQQEKKKSDAYLQLSLRMDEFQLFVWEKTEV